MLVSLIVPCFNEESSLPILKTALDAVKAERPEFGYEYIFIDDGSTDRTLSILESFALEDHAVHYVSFSRNFGKEAAGFHALANRKYAVFLPVDSTC